MAHWFHRNPIKASAPVSFESIRHIATNPSATKILSCVADAVFELMSMCINVALWLTKHAAKVAGKEDITMDEAKEVHTCLRTAGGMFQYVKDSLLPKLGDISAEKGADTDARVIEACKMQCVAEAQEVTVARAVELKHKASLIASLANETSGLFTAAGDSLKSVDDTKAGKWRKYLEMKAAFYLSYAHCFQGELLLDEEECGKAIRSLQESDTMYKKAEALCKEYSSTKGAGSTARPQEHPFFKRIGPLMKTRLDKATRENGFIYFHKVPAEPPDLELKATYGLASPQEFSIPAAISTWTDAYAGFDASKAQSPKVSQCLKAAGGSGEDIKPVHENEDKGPVKPAKNTSGCVIS
ncbi:hypothetical protein QZH41_012577 [Actinostola sp. cb2023]|nr:hypothetical protein QZH41_012577 [Actinostola sp. cb2023]